jgi:hypothetical protein
MRLRRLHAKLWMLVVTMLIASCDRNQAKPPRRSPGVPEAAVWAGGPDGGSFILCEVNSAASMNTCRVWNHQTGALVESDDHRLLKEDRTATIAELNYAWADRGGWIGLKSGLILDSTDHRHPR